MGSIRPYDGRIVGMTPQPDRLQRVTWFVEYALGPEIAGTANNTEAEPLELDAAPSRSSVWSGEGGIPLLSWQALPLIVLTGRMTPR